MIAGGSFRNETEIVVEGLRLLRSREELRADVNAGIDELDRGLGVDAASVFARLKARAKDLDQASK
jgi:antitoxin ParD1/3/4